jgi:hypothetical protein
VEPLCQASADQHLRGRRARPPVWRIALPLSCT